MKKKIFILAVSATLLACGSSKSALTAATKQSVTTTEQTTTTLDYIRKVSDNAVFAKNIVSDIDFGISNEGKTMSLDGRLQMRRDECIRITITPFGLMEVARLEFTPDYVLIMDRYHKQYVKGSYKDVDFLKNNGIDFYTLQSLFWNELFQPGKQKLTDNDLSAFVTDLAVKENRPISLTTGKFNFCWTTDVVRALINSAVVEYGKGTADESTMTFDYADFVPLGAKKFPSKITLSFRSSAIKSQEAEAVKGKENMSMILTLGKIGTDAGWDTHTSISSSYKEVTAQDLFNSIANMKM